MEYTDDGITLDYNFLEKCMKNKNKANTEDLLSNNRERRWAKKFRPPVITDKLPIINNSFLIEEPDFEEEYKQSADYRKTMKKLPKIQIEEVESSSMQDLMPVVEIEVEDLDDEGLADNYENERESEKEEEEYRRAIKKVKNKRIYDRRAVIWTGESVTVPLKTPDIVYYLENRIPSQWPEFETNDICKINQMFYMDPLSLLKPNR